MALDKTLMVVSREWHNPSIRVSVDEVGIAVSMLLPDFLQALALELSADPDSLFAAADKVVCGMKQETGRAM